VGMTLADVAKSSKGKFKPSALGGYERGERLISIPRLCELAEVYGTPADRLLGEVLDGLDPVGRKEVIIDLTRLARVETDNMAPVAEFIHEVRTQRADYLADVITLRAGDLQELSMRTHYSPEALLEKLSPAIRSGPPAG
jgi:transcriptional regulator with XRE-family HTH domain